MLAWNCLQPASPNWGAGVRLRDVWEKGQKMCSCRCRVRHREMQYEALALKVIAVAEEIIES
jgi:hypothetical protein